MSRGFTLLARGLLLRCPRCGKGKLFQGIFKMNECCSVCGLVYEREEGYFSSSMAINIVVSEFILAGVALPLAWNPHIQIFQALPIGIALAILLPLIFYRHSRSLWLSVDHWLHPLNSDPT